jgi:uncharacterized OsmC-like protein
VICDQPLENGGSDEGMTPPEFLLASLATCGAYYAAQYLKTRGLPAGSLRVRVTAEKGKASRREFDDGHHLFLRQMEPVHNLADRRVNFQIVEHN